MDKQPDGITVCTLNCVLMPQGEIICLGKSIGWFKDFKNEIDGVSNVDGSPFKTEDKK